MGTNLTARRVLRAVRRRVLGQVEESSPWAALLRRDAAAWNRAKEAARGGPRILLATSMGGYPHGAVVESALAVALTLRGAQVDVLLCDSFLPACQLTELGFHTPELLDGQESQPRCATCQPFGLGVFDPLGLKIRRYSQEVAPEQVSSARELAASVPMDELGSFRLDGMAVGEHALAGALRYFARADLRGEPHAEPIARRYLRSAILTTYATQGLLREQDYDAVCFNHGIYVPQGLIGEVCRREGVRVVTWNPAYRKHCFIFSHQDSYHHTMITEPTSEWESVDWTAQVEAATLDYLKSRWQGTQDWIWFHESPQEDMDQLAVEFGIDWSRPCVSLLTSVVWDAQLHYASNAFPSMLDWLRETIHYFERRPDLQLVIRVHPAEVRGAIPSRQPAVTEIEAWFPHLPSNVFVIPPEHHASTYALIERSNAVLVYSTKTGIEISSMGVPVIVAGEAWIRNKGFSLDASSPEEYFGILDRLPLAERLSPQQLERARKYAFHFFLRRMIPLPFIDASSTWGFTPRLSRLEELRSGHYPGLDVICDGILDGTSFTYPAERLQ